MQRSGIAIIKNFILLLSAVVALYCAKVASDGTMDEGMVVMLLWIVSPYFCFFLASYFLERFTSIKPLPVIDLTISLVALAFTWFAYVPVVFGDHHSSTEGLIFLFLPLWLLIGSFVLLGLAILVVCTFPRDPNQ
jgi:hypothetical protein